MDAITIIDKGFAKKINIEQAKGSTSSWKAALRMHGAKVGYLVDVDTTTGDATWSAATTLAMKAGSYDLEVWDASLTSVKFYRQERYAKTKDTYISLNQ